ncbi:TolB family protein [Heliorestis convoluta]|uniref:Dipeptidylpeptidase IV N-terminal domain-containing protein n=1 Tax=Heliorestis convoluta TaxID=356322 RepID=A0A5Q2MZX8_9FIRM|nr:hypothetical protein [Heliorestis convoluta]QGG46502.1 hypothetical protein FTV88_0323 [Heliorestis convoluta]
MNRFRSGIPFLTALLIVFFAAINYVVTERTPDEVLEDQSWPVPEMECTEINVSSFSSESTFQWVHLQSLCEKAVEDANQAYSTGAEQAMEQEKETEQKRTTASKEPKKDDTIIWSSLQLNNQKNQVAFYTQKRLYLLDVTTGSSKVLHSLSEDDKSVQYVPTISWSPQGEYLTFTLLKENQRWNGHDSYSIHLVDLKTEEILLIHQSTRAPDKPSWSPKDPIVALDSPVILYDVEKQQGTPVISGYQTRHPRWSPEGNHIIFIQETSSTRGETFRYSLDTREVMQITTLNRVTSPLLWLQTPPTILLEVETKRSGSRPERHHIGEARPHTESSIRWLSPFDRNESNRFLSISPNERYLIVQKTTNLGTADEKSHLIALNRDLSFYRWRCVTLAPLEDPSTVTLHWTADGRLLYSTEGEVFLFDFEQLTKEKLEEKEEAFQILGIDNQIIYYSPL